MAGEVVIGAQLQEWLRSRGCALLCRCQGKDVHVTLKSPEGVLVTASSPDLDEAIRLAQLEYDAVTLLARTS